MSDAPLSTGQPHQRTSPACFFHSAYPKRIKLIRPAVPMSQTYLNDDAARPARTPAVGGGPENELDSNHGSIMSPYALSLFGQRPYAAWSIAIVAVLGGIAGVIWWLNTRDYESTDDAFIDARNVNISSLVTGAIVAVPVTDNQLVQTGDVLVQSNPRDYQAAVAQALAQVAEAKAAIANLDAQIVAQNARIDQAEKQIVRTQAARTFARQENDRAQDLARQGAGTQQQAQQTASTLVEAEANLASAQANAAAAQKQVPILDAQRESAQAQLMAAQAALTLAQANLARTRVTALEPGRATKISAAVGAVAQPGQILMIFVPQEKWVTANFKETQLTFMRPGQRADIAIDAYPERIFSGHVDSIQAGSGAAFSLLPPENATGNYVKVVQRIPVKITFDKPPYVYIGSGMSVVPSVKVR
jgi:membrane fusion protein, multidrug efflux system